MRALATLDVPNAPVERCGCGNYGCWETQVSERALFEQERMASVGLLAGGIAHDFNNILTAIIGFANLVEMRMDKQDPSMQYLEQVLAAADRATHLTQGLLAFSRRQVINPQPIDLHSIITNVEKLLKRLISEIGRSRSSRWS